MSIALEAYTAEGLLTGAVAGTGRLSDLLATETAASVENAVIRPFEGLPRRVAGSLTVELDDLMVVVVSPETVTPVHAVWHPVSLDLGPYRVRGALPSLPGFDPARALARPSGPFVLLGRVTVELRRGSPAGPAYEHAFALVNRYAVDAVESDISLAFFFPGAHTRSSPPAIA